MQTTRLMLLLAGALIALMGCGQKGPLYLEQPPSGPEPQAGEENGPAGHPKGLDRSLPETRVMPAGDVPETSGGPVDDTRSRAD